MSNTQIIVPATSAVKEFQKVNALGTLRIMEASDKNVRAFWVKYIDESANDIAARNNMTVAALVDAWLNWVSQVEAARAKVGA